jgi:hypothetical protein
MTKFHNLSVMQGCALYPSPELESDRETSGLYGSEEKCKCLLHCRRHLHFSSEQMPSTLQIFFQEIVALDSWLQILTVHVVYFIFYVE